MYIKNEFQFCVSRESSEVERSRTEVHFSSPIFSVQGVDSRFERVCDTGQELVVCQQHES